MADSGKTGVAALGLIVLVALAEALPFTDRDLVNSLETGYAVTVQETVRDGHWVVPTQNALPRLLKPPLPFWIAALACRVAGADTAPMAVLRFCSAVTGALTAILIYLLGAKLFDRRAAVWAALIWATCYLTVYEMRYARHDIYLACAVALTMLGIWMVLERQRGGWPVTLIGQVLAMQAKGPVSWGLTVLPALVYIGWRRPDRWRTVPGLLGGMALGAVLLIPWAAAMQARMPLDLAPIYFHETVGRFRAGDVSGASPLFYLEFLAYVLPWLFFFLAGCIAPFRAQAPEPRSGRWFAWLWMVVGLVFLSLAREKRSRYAVPLMAPAALLMGEVVATHLRARLGAGDRRTLLWKAHAALLLAAAVGVPLGLSLRHLLHPAAAALCGLALLAPAVGVAMTVIPPVYVPIG